MTIIELLRAECRAKGVPEKYAEKIQKVFNIEKEEGISTYVSMFKDNLLSDIEKVEQPKADIEKAAKEVAIAEYEKLNGLKDGKLLNPNEAPKLEGLDPAIKTLIEAQNQQLNDMKKLLETSQKKTLQTEQAGKAKALIASAKLPENWLSRINLESETTLEDQVKALGEEYTKIQQDVIDAKVASGEYTLGSVHIPDRSEADWVNLMNSDVKASNDPGVVDLGLSK